MPFTRSEHHIRSGLYMQGPGNRLARIPEMCLALATHILLDHGALNVLNFSVMDRATYDLVLPVRVRELSVHVSLLHSLKKLFLNRPQAVLACRSLTVNDGHFTCSCKRSR